MKNTYSIDFGVTEFWRFQVNGIQRGWLTKVNFNFYYNREDRSGKVQSYRVAKGLEAAIRELVEKHEKLSRVK